MTKFDRRYHCLVLPDLKYLALKLGGQIAWHGLGFACAYHQLAREAYRRGAACLTDAEALEDWLETELLNHAEAAIRERDRALGCGFLDPEVLP